MASKGSRTAAYKNTALCTRNSSFMQQRRVWRSDVFMNLMSKGLQRVPIKQVQQEETVLFLGIKPQAG